MPKGQKYIDLTRVLNVQIPKPCTFTFDQIVEICGGLPPSAYQYPALWNNHSGNPLSYGWLLADYVSEHLDIHNQNISFRYDPVLAQHCLVQAASYGTAVQQRPVPIPTISPSTVDELLKNGCYFRDNLKDSPHGRYRSWEHCYSFFAAHHDHPSTEEKDLLCLHLAWYLASWGMLRNSFLGEMDYTVHGNAVELLTSPEWCDLYHPSVELLILSENARRIEALSKRLNCAYQSAACFTQDTTDTLTTKVLLGTLGCCPAYDRYFKSAVRKTCRGLGSFNASSISALAQLYQNYADKFEPFRLSCNLYGVEYPPMKALDMCFFMSGFRSGNVDDNTH